MACKWCQLGECWTHGQIAKPAGQKNGKAPNPAAPKPVGVLPAAKPVGGVKQATGKKAFGAEAMQEMWQQQMMMFQQMKGGAMGGSGSLAAKGWKQRLHETLTKHTIPFPEYSSTEAEGGGFTGTATVQGQQFTSEEPAKSKKDAESNAAKEALKTLYPEVFGAVSLEGAAGDAGMMMFPGMMMGEAAGKGTKRKGVPIENPKVKLMNAIQIFVNHQAGRMVNKNDIVYTLTEVSEGPPKTYQATVVIPEYNSGMSFAGEVVAGKKGAEESAAKAAYDEMESILAPLVEEHAAKKKKNNQEALAELKRQTDEKKAAKKLAAEAGSTT